MMLVQHLVQPAERPSSHSPIPIPADSLTDPSSNTPASTSTPAPLQLTRDQWESSKPSTPKPTTKPNFTLQPATLDDAPQIAQLGGGTFASTFGFSMPINDLNAYLQESYSVEAISADICEAGKHFLVATKSQSQPHDDQLIGFAQLTEGTTESCLSHFSQPSLVELQRLYVSRDAQGLGVGKTLMSSIETRARDLGYKYMWLGVWEGNFIAQRVYESMGFERVGDHEFRMGRCIQTDWIMVKEL